MLTFLVSRIRWSTLSVVWACASAGSNAARNSICRSIAWTSRYGVKGAPGNEPGPAVARLASECDPRATQERGNLGLMLPKAGVQHGSNPEGNSVRSVARRETEAVMPARRIGDPGLMARRSEVHVLPPEGARGGARRRLRIYGACAVFSESPAWRRGLPLGGCLRPPVPQALGRPAVA